MAQFDQATRESGVRLCLLEAAAQLPAVKQELDPGRAAQIALDIAKKWYHYVAGLEEEAVGEMFD